MTREELAKEVSDYITNELPTGDIDFDDAAASVQSFIEDLEENEDGEDA